MVEHKFIPADIAFFFQKKLTGRLPLEADIGGVRLRQHRLIGVQPAALAGVTKQSGQFVLMRPLDPVQVE